MIFLFLKRVRVCARILGERAEKDGDRGQIHAAEVENKSRITDGLRGQEPLQTGPSIKPLSNTPTRPLLTPLIL